MQQLLAGVQVVAPHLHGKDIVIGKGQIVAVVVLCPAAIDVKLLFSLIDKDVEEQGIFAKCIAFIGLGMPEPALVVRRHRHGDGRNLLKFIALEAIADAVIVHIGAIHGKDAQHHGMNLTAAIDKVYRFSIGRGCHRQHLDRNSRFGGCAIRPISRHQIVQFKNNVG